MLPKNSEELKKCSWSLQDVPSAVRAWAIYGKGEKVDLTPADKKQLRKIVENWK